MLIDNSHTVKGMKGRSAPSAPTSLAVRSAVSAASSSRPLQAPKTPVQARAQHGSRHWRHGSHPSAQQWWMTNSVWSVQMQILFSLKKERNSKTCYHMEEP